MLWYLIKDGILVPQRDLTMTLIEGTPMMQDYLVTEAAGNSSSGCVMLNQSRCSLVSSMETCGFYAVGVVKSCSYI